MKLTARTATLLWLALLLACLAWPAREGFSQAAPAPGKPIIYEFGRPDCPVCQKMKEILTEIQARHGGEVEVRFLAFDTEEHLFRRFHVIIVPTQVFLDGSGREVFRHEGPLGKEETVKKLQELGFIRE